jgi:hypothetical protein
VEHITGLVGRSLGFGLSGGFGAEMRTTEPDGEVSGHRMRMVEED